MPYKFTNQEVSQILKEVIAAMEVKDENKFKLRAFQNVVSSIETSTYSVFDLWEKERLKEISGVGESLSGYLNELFSEGKVGEFEHLKKDLPDGMFALIGIQGIGAKKAYKLATSLGLKDRSSAVNKVYEAAKTGKIRILEGFGETSEKQLLEAIAQLKVTKKDKPRLLWHQGDEVVQRIYRYMSKLNLVLQIEALGSYRRKKETIGDLDIAVSTYADQEVMSYFLEFPEIKEILAQGDKKISVVLKNDLQVDFRAVHPKQFGSMVQYFTGSKYHNIALRSYAISKGFSVSEYGIKKDRKLHEFSTEEDFYNFLGLQYIPPEIRQGKDEIDLASQKLIPDLVKISDIKGDIHTHTTFSDGENTLETMIKTAKERGYEYYGFSDHAPSISSRGYEEVEKIIDQTSQKVADINRDDPNFRVLYGYEVNILADATLSLPDKLLSKLDYVIAGMHTSQNQSREAIMNRYRMALYHPLVNIIAHPSGRLLNERDGMDMDWMAFLEEVAKAGKILEINSQPQRLDLPYDMVKEAKELGIKLIINTDAHSAKSLDFMRYGVNVAKRGWCEKKDIINTLLTDDFLRVLKSKKV